MSDTQLAERIRSDQIDILIDLAGHTADNRLPVFAHKPAPIQVSFLGYPVTTGLSRIDYFLTDAIRQPDDPQQFFTECPILLPHGAACFQAQDAPDVSAPAFIRNGRLTLGSTHRPEKISAAALRMWSDILSAVPDARLLIFRDSLKNDSLREHMRQQLQQSGADLSRVEFGWDMPAHHQLVYSDIDILLDVFPWGSGTIAYDAMWMGVPIPTLAGNHGSCRATASMLHHCGYPELVAHSPDRYLSLVCQLADDRDRLSALRRELRPAMKTSVCNAQRFAADVEAVFRQAWHTYLQSPPSDACSESR